MEEELERDMKPRLIGDLGMGFATEKSNRRYRYGLYECQFCNIEFEAITKNVKRGFTRSCGCQKGGITHRLTHNQFYKTWNAMMSRCTNLKHKSYPNYGARGITVCDEWLDVTNFVAWVDSTHPNISGVSLDRIDNDKGYSPDNCTWSSRTMQNINKRMQVTNTSGFVGVSWHKGSTKWAAYISVTNTRKHIGYFDLKEEAVLARDQYIIKNKLPHKLSTQY